MVSQIVLLYFLLIFNLPQAKLLPKSKLVVANSTNITISASTGKLREVHRGNSNNFTLFPSLSRLPSKAPNFISTSRQRRRRASLENAKLLSPPHVVPVAGDPRRRRRNFNNDFIRGTTANSQLVAEASSLLSPTEESRVKEKSLAALGTYSNLEKRTMESKPDGEPSVLDKPSEEPSLLLNLDRSYTPKEIAEYIASTGDEKGIIQVISDMLYDGQLMPSKDDVILFLETVQRELDKLKKKRRTWNLSAA